MNYNLLFRIWLRLIYYNMLKPSFSSSRETAHSSWGEGLRVKPTRGVRSRSSSETPGGGVKQKRCMIVVKKMKSSILARPSPRQILRPVRLKKKKRTEECAGEANCQETDNWWEIMPQLTNLRRKAWRRLAWQTFHLCPGSGQDERCMASPTHSHHTGQMSGEDTLWSPGDMQQFKGFIIISATFC